MKPCRYLPLSKGLLIVGTTVFSAVALICFCGAVLAFVEIFCCAVLSASQSALACSTAIFLLAIAFVISLGAYKFYTMETRKYSISEKGLTLSDRNKNFYEWSEISEISIVAYGASASLENYQSVICVFLEPRPEDFLRKILRSSFFAVLNQSRFVIIDYSRSVVDGIKEVYHCEIKDYREKQLR